MYETWNQFHRKFQDQLWILRFPTQRFFYEKISTLMFESTDRQFRMRVHFEEIFLQKLDG